jgi:CheY-like chemotaxis protein
MSRKRLTPADACMSTDLPKVPKVLIVEDEMMLRMRAVDIVEDAGFSPVQAINADQALSILESRSDISLLFTDIQMPGSMDGLKLAHAVHDRWPAIKIILVSGQVNPSDAERPKDSRFFGKPLSDGQMIAELQAMVGAGALKTVPNASLLLADEFGYSCAIWMCRHLLNSKMRCARWPNPGTDGTSSILHVGQLGGLMIDGRSRRLGRISVTTFPLKQAGAQHSQSP